MKSWFFRILAFFAAAPGVLSSNPDLAAGFSALDIEPVWAGHPVDFCLLTRNDRQFAAYYDASRQLSVAQRALGGKQWKITKLDSFVEWDSHNDLRMAVDREGYLHLAGNMHVAPLVYFRSRKPLDAASLERIPSMTGQRESRCTYPYFVHDPEGALIFRYRDGKSGGGDTIENIYDEKTRSWSRLHDAPLFDGKGERNAYPLAPKRGPDGWYHLTWVWRDTPDARTNHDLGYARSRNLRDWETVDGQPIKLPITAGTKGVTVDPIPVGGGIINGSGRAGFDLENRVVIAYHKFDEAGHTQLYFARFEEGAWKKYQATHWNYRWDFGGGGSLESELRHGPLEADGGRLVIFIQHKEFGGSWEVDGRTLELKERTTVAEKAPPAEYRGVRSDFPGMKVRWISDSGEKREDGVDYRLRWETLGPNRDHPRDKPWPEPVMLQLVILP